MADGRTNAEIADTLNLSVFTVKNHVSSILMKLHAQSRTEATAILLRGHATEPRAIAAVVLSAPLLRTGADVARAALLPVPGTILRSCIEHAIACTGGSA